MEAEIFDKMYELDSYHWWFYGQREWLKKFYRTSTGKNKAWLDIGCGVGDILRMVKSDFDVFGVDRNPIALSYTKKRGIPNLVKTDALKLPFKDESFDFVSLLGVMYHRDIKDDETCLRECIRVSKKGGVLFFSEPVVFLNGAHDIKEHTGRKYSLKSLKRLISGSGLKIEKITYFNFFAFLPIFLLRKIEILSRKKEDDLKRPNAIVNSIMKILVKLESIWIKRFYLPFGSSIICVARKV
ncbi:MAG: class I SAM-dependent methyltransferase [Candidatus Omnitrophota bacterium]